MKRVLSLLLIVMTCVYAQDSETDSLKQELAVINAKLKLYEQAETVKDQNSQDTSECGKTADNPCRKKVERDSKVREPREPGVGGAGGIVFGFKAINLEPLKESILFNQGRRGEESPYYNLDVVSKLDGTYETFPIFGGKGLIGVGNGVRVGAGGYGGVKNYRIWNKDRDSVYSMLVWVGYGGLEFEKSFDFKEANLLVGTNLGAGSMGSAFFNEEKVNYTYESDSDSLLQDKDVYSDWATFFSAEFHAGATYTFLPWFHMGAEFSGALFVSNSGFRNGESFATFNPGAQLRIMFGRVS